MPAKCKYVMFADCFPVVFCIAIPHDDVARGINMKPTSAGFCDVSAEEGKIEVICYGKSESLDLKPCGTDAKIIQRLLNGTY